LIYLILVTLILLNNTTYPGGYIDLKVVDGKENVSMFLIDNCTYFYNNNKSKIPAKSGYYRIYVSYSCKPGNKSILVDGRCYNFTVLKPDYYYLLNSTIRLEREIKLLQDKIKSLTTRNRELTENLSKSKLENLNLTAKIQNIFNELKYHKNIIKQLEENNRKLKDERIKLLEQINNLTSTIENLEIEKSNLNLVIKYLEIFVTFIIAFIVGSYLAIITRR